MENGLKGAVAFAFGGGKLRRHLSTQRHQFCHFGDDAALLGDGWDHHWEAPQLCGSDACSSKAG